MKYLEFFSIYGKMTLRMMYNFYLYSGNARIEKNAELRKEKSLDEKLLKFKNELLNIEKKVQIYSELIRRTKENKEHYLKMFEHKNLN